MYLKATNKKRSIAIELKNVRIEFIWNFVPKKLETANLIVIFKERMFLG